MHCIRLMRHTSVIQGRINYNFVYMPRLDLPYNTFIAYIGQRSCVIGHHYTYIRHPLHTGVINKVDALSGIYLRKLVFTRIVVPTASTA